MSIIQSLLKEYADDKQLQNLSRIDRERIVYAQLKREADAKFKFIAGGTARKVYEYKDDTVVKVAFNDKGIAQNEQEAQLGQEFYTAEILARVHYASENYSFLISEKATKAKTSDFERIEGIKFKDFIQFVDWMDITFGRRRGWGKVEKPHEEIFENEFVYDFQNFVANYGLENVLGDFKRISSFGVVKRDGQESIVIIDYGLNDKILSRYY